MIWFEEILQGIYTIQYDALLVTFGYIGYIYVIKIYTAFIIRYTIV